MESTNLHKAGQWIKKCKIKKKKQKSYKNEKAKLKALNTCNEKLSPHDAGIDANIKKQKNYKKKDDD